MKGRFPGKDVKALVEKALDGFRVAIENGMAEAPTGAAGRHQENHGENQDCNGARRFMHVSDRRFTPHAAAQSLRLADKP